MNDSGATFEALEGRSPGGYRAVSKSNTVTYAETMEAAFPDKERVAEAKAKLVEAGVKYVMSCWIDIMGQPKTKPVPIGEFGAIVIVAGCGSGDAAAGWEAGAAVATISLDDGTSTTFQGGTCIAGTLEGGRDSFRLEVGEPGGNGEGVLVNLGLDLAGGATVAGDGSGNGVQVDHAGGRWGLAEGPESFRLSDDLSGGTADLMGLRTLGADADPRSGTLEFTC